MAASSTSWPRADESPRPRPMPSTRGPLRNVRVLELEGIRSEYCGLLLSGLGADVVKLEMAGVASSRVNGPFVSDGRGRRHSIHHWVYNRGKRSVEIDPLDTADREVFPVLWGAADVILDGGTDGFAHLLPRRGDPGAIPERIWLRLTDFGPTGPWAGYRASDLVHLALGGITMNCGYDPKPDGSYDLPPIAPQAMHAYHIAGENAAIAILAAIVHRDRTGRAQELDLSIHEAVSKNTEQDFMSWIMLAQRFYRQTCRHAGPTLKAPTLAPTKDGRLILAMPDQWSGNAELAQYLREKGMGSLMPTELESQEAAPVPGVRVIPGASSPMNPAIDAVRRYAEKYTWNEFPWVEAQSRGMLWAPIRKPHENLFDEHWRERGTFGEIWHEELQKSIAYPISKWISTRPSWWVGKAAPGVDGDRESVIADWARASQSECQMSPVRAARRYGHGKDWSGPLEGIRILDFTWFLASSGATRWLAALGAEVIKVEWKEHPDSGRGSLVPEGGREARAEATAPVKDVKDPRVGGQFNNKNAGKRGISLNLAHPKGLELAKQCLEHCDVVMEGFSPGVMERLGFGYEVQRRIRPDVIYVQQSGMGSVGRYGRIRTLGPIAAAISGITEMSGFSDPFPPAGWGYSYLDWFGAYSMALAALSAVVERGRTGEGQWIDASQAEVGIFLTALEVVNYGANGTVWQRVGNAAPYVLAAPHGIFRCQGTDNWIAIACFSDEEWVRLCGVLGIEAAARDPKYGGVEQRIRNERQLRALVTERTELRERYELMDALQSVGIAAGVCQSMEDRYERDPQLAGGRWVTEVTATGLGTWPVAEFPVQFSETPPRAGGRHGRGAPLYGEDNDLVYGDMLGLTAEEIVELGRQGVI